MNETIRGHQLLKHDDAISPSLLWREIERAVHNKIKIKPFDTIGPETFKDFEYLQSQSIPSRFDLIDGHSRYQADLGAIQSALGPKQASLGRIETDVLCFCISQNPQLCVLLGGTGSGKSTTLKYLKRHHIHNVNVAG
jgi:hypothetical protein